MPAVPMIVGLSKVTVDAIAIYVGICGITTPTQCGKEYTRVMGEIQKKLKLSGESLARMMKEVASFFSKIGQDKNDPSIEALRMYNEQMIKEDRPKNLCEQQIELLTAQGRLDVATALAKLCGLGSKTKSTAAERCNNIVNFDRSSRNMSRDIEDDMINFIKNN